MERRKKKREERGSDYGEGKLEMREERAACESTIYGKGNR